MRAITSLTVFLVLLVAIGLVVPSGAAAVKYGKLCPGDKRAICAYNSDGSLTPLKYKWGEGPLYVTATMPNGYAADTPTKVVLTYKYRNAKLRMANRRYRKMTYRKWFGKRKLRVKDVSLNANWWNTGRQDFDSFSKHLKLKAIKMGQTRKVTFTLTFPCMQPLDAVFLHDVYPQLSVFPWQCMPPFVDFTFEAYISRSKPSSFAAPGHVFSQQGVFVHPGTGPTG